MIFAYKCNQWTIREHFSILQFLDIFIIIGLHPLLLFNIIQVLLRPAKPRTTPGSKVLFHWVCHSSDSSTQQTIQHGPTSWLPAVDI